MKLKVIVDELNLSVENDRKIFGEVFEVSEARAKEILKYRFNGQPVVVAVQENDEELSNKVQFLEEQITELEKTNSILMEENNTLKEQITELENSLTLEENKKSQDKKGKEDK